MSFDQGAYQCTDADQCTQDAIEAFVKDLSPQQALVGACNYISCACPPSGTFNFFKLYYCHMDQSIAGMVPICVIILILCFYLLGTTADGYLAPALECISVELGTSEQLAGVTFLAFANGAPDVIGAIAASGSAGGDGVGLAVGAIAGAGVYVSGVVSGLVAIAATESIHVVPRVFLRDLIFYILSLGLLLASSFTEGISLYFSIGFLVWYAIFIVLVFIEDQREKKEHLRIEKEREQQLEEGLLEKDSIRKTVWEEEEEAEEHAKEDYLEEIYHTKLSINDEAVAKLESDKEEGDEESRPSIYSEAENEKNELKDDHDTNADIQKHHDHNIQESHFHHEESEEEEKEGEGDTTVEKEPIKKQKTDVINITEHLHGKDEAEGDEEEEEEEDNDEKKKPLKKKGTLRRGLTKVKHQVTWGSFKMRGFLKRAIEGEDPWEDMNAFQKAVFITCDAPWDFVRRLTIPPPCREMWFRKFGVIWPIPAVIFFFLSNSLLPFDAAPPFYFYICLGVGFVASCFFYCMTKPTTPPNWIIVFALGAFIMSILWINWISNVLVDLLTLLGLMFGIPLAYLGLTILALGNSVGDTVANYGVAKRGLAKMAITGCFAGPFFNVCLGLGLSMTIQNISTGKVPDFQFTEQQSFLPMLILLPLIAMLFYITISTAINKFVLKNLQGYIQIFWYVAVLSVVTVAAFGFSEGRL